MNFSSSRFLKAVGIVMICGLAFPTMAMAATYRVKSGDSLWAIARQYGITVNRLQSLNGINGSLIFPGQVLTVDGQQSTPPSNSGGNRSNYTVRRGDSLWAIAVRYGTTVSVLQQLNRMAGSMIFPGQVLVIAGQSAPAPVTPPAPPAPPTGSNNGNSTTYTVRSGDSLWAIAARYGTTIGALQGLNRINGWLIYPGQVLTISGQAQPPSNSGGSSRGGNPQGIVSTALRFLGTPYRWGGTSPQTGFDCSGFVQYVFGLNGISLPRVASAQAKVGTEITSIGSLQPGDIVYFGKGQDHVAIYAGNGQLVTTSNSRNSVIETSIYSYWYQYFTNGARVR